MPRLGSGAFGVIFTAILLGLGWVIGQRVAGRLPLL